MGNQSHTYARLTRLVVAVIAAALFAASSNSFADDGIAQEARKPLKVLMVGNSFSLSCMTHLPKVAESMGFELDLASMYIGGCSLERHVQNINAQSPDFTPYVVQRSKTGATFRSNVPEMLQADAWDVVTIQQASGESWKAQTYHPFGDELVSTIRKLTPTAEIVVQETWSYTPWDKRLKKWKLTQDEMYARLHAADADFAAAYGFRVIPTGAAVQEWRKRLPVQYAENSFGGDVVGGRNKPVGEQFVQKDGKWVVSSDTFHLNDDGEYLQALVWAAFLFDADVTKCDYSPPGLPLEKAALMKQIAMESVHFASKPVIAVETQSDVAIKRNIAYSEFNECRLDIRHPSSAKSFPTVVWFHGGGLVKGKREFLPLADDGIAQVAVDYRLLGKGAKSGVECIEDAAAAVAWVFKHIAEYGGDSNMVFVCGMSAGGYLSMMVGMDPKYLAAHGIENKDIAGIVAISGQATKHFNVRKFAGDTDPQFLPKIDDTAPLAHVGADLPPLLCICGQPPYEWKCRSEENRLLVASCAALGHKSARFVELDFCNHSQAYRAGLPYLEMFVKERTR